MVFVHLRCESVCRSVCLYLCVHIGGRLGMSVYVASVCFVFVGFVMWVCLFVCLSVYMYVGLPMMSLFAPMGQWTFVFLPIVRSSIWSIMSPPDAMVICVDYGVGLDYE